MSEIELFLSQFELTELQKEALTALGIGLGVIAGLISLGFRMARLIDMLKIEENEKNR